MRVRDIGVAVCCMAFLAPAASVAQPRASERSTVRQAVNGTTITLDFSRPVARGRTNLIGGVVHWGEMWTPGANWATTLEVDKPIRLNGHAIPAGKYSVWMQPQPDEWTVFVNRDPHLYHDQPVPEDEHLVQFTVVPEEGAHMEALAWYFPVVGPTTVTLRMHWGTTYVPLAIETMPYEPPTLPAEVWAGYVGSYAITGNDPTTGRAMDFTITILEDDGRLAGRWGRAPVALIPHGEHHLLVGFYRNGELFDVGDDIVLRLVMDGAQASGMEMLFDGKPFAVGPRT